MLRQRILPFIVSNSLSLIITDSLVGALTYALSPESGDGRYVTYAIVVTTLLLPFFLYLSRRPEVANYNVADWLKALLIAFLFVGGSGVVDVIIGLITHPNLPLNQSAISNVGIWVTLFLVPILLATVYCTINAILLKALTARNAPSAS